MTQQTFTYIEVAHMTAASIAQLPAKDQANALKSTIALHDVFLGVLPPGQKPPFVIIKGKELLAAIACSDKPRETLCGAILVSTEEEALAMRQAYSGENSTWLDS